MALNANGAPYSYDYINTHTAPITPSTLHIKNSGLSRFFQRYLLQKAMSVYTWELPESWDRDYFLYTLYARGRVAVFDAGDYGVIPQQCGLAGYDIFYRPTTAIIANPILKEFKNLRIHSDCTLFKLEPDYGSVMDIVQYYADNMALCAQSAGVNILNSHMAYTFVTGSKSAAEAMKKLYDQIASGEPAAFYDKSYRDDINGEQPWSAFTQNVGQNFIAPQLFELLHYLELRFDTDLGIPNANTDKRERLGTDEVNSNNIETLSKCALWLEGLQNTAKETNEKFYGGADVIRVDWRFKTVLTSEEALNERDALDTGTVQDKA